MEDVNLLQNEFKAPIRHFPLKRLFDIFFSLAVFLLFSPLFLFIALAIRLTSRGEVIYAHVRIGRGGVPFRCYKFRTMYKDAEKRLRTLLRDNPEMRREWQEKRKLKNDPRITPVGRLLRKSSLDELPQFWNVLKGNLSVVGPRPVVRTELNQFYGAKASKVLSLRPGLTGIWQVSGRNDISYNSRVKLDEEYVNTRSFLLDLKLICKTIPAMLFSKGAY
jgi:exopolysaccharide production protein ExoY